MIPYPPDREAHRPNNGGPIATASGLLFIAAATDNLLTAADIETGEMVGSAAG